REPWCRPDVVNAGRPGGVIGVVVLRAEWRQPEFPGCEPIGHREVLRNEQLIVHPAILTRLLRQALRHRGDGRASATPKDRLTIMLADHVAWPADGRGAVAGGPV